MGRTAARTVQAGSASAAAAAEVRLSSELDCRESAPASLLRDTPAGGAVVHGRIHLISFLFILSLFFLIHGAIPKGFFTQRILLVNGERKKSFYAIILRKKDQNRFECQKL